VLTVKKDRAGEQEQQDEPAGSCAAVFSGFGTARHAHI